MQNATDWEPVGRPSAFGAANTTVTSKSSKFELPTQEKASMPRVEKFAENIYDRVYYSDSAVYEYIEAFYEGYGFQDYSFAQECFDDKTLFLDQLHNFHLNMTRRRDWSEPYFLTF